MEKVSGSGKLKSAEEIWCIPRVAVGEDPITRRGDGKDQAEPRKWGAREGTIDQVQKAEEHR